MRKVRWGILSTAAIAREMVPAFHQVNHGAIRAISSRDESRAQAVATSLNIPIAYGSYEDLLSDPDIDAVYNPLPNHLHVHWSLKAIEAGKHVLCEKPLCATLAEAKALIAARNLHKVQVGEGFMFRCHAQWSLVRQLLDDRRIGKLRSINAHFSYWNIDPSDVRNQVSCQGGALMDVGSYLIHASRFSFGEEPLHAMAFSESDPQLGTDRLTSTLLQFPSGHALLSCSTQSTPYQSIQLFGTEGMMSVLTPFNVPRDRPAQVIIESGTGFWNKSIVREQIPPQDQHQLQIDAFCRAILDGFKVSVPLEDSARNAAVLEAIRRSIDNASCEPVRH